MLTGRVVTAPPPPGSATREVGGSTSVDTDLEPGWLWGALPGSTQLALYLILQKATPRLQLASGSPRAETRGSWARTSPSCELAS